MEVSPYDATFGHTPGATVNISTRSGTNQIHGDLRYWFRNSALDAPNWFENRNGTKPAVYQDNRYGASAGGPGWIPKLYDGRNRTFWFYAYEGNQWGRPTSSTNTVPTIAQRTGDFSALLSIPNGSRYQIFDPFSTRTAPSGRFQRNPLGGNIIPRSRLDAVGLNLVTLYPISRGATMVPTITSTPTFVSRSTTRSSAASTTRSGKGTAFSSACTTTTGSAGRTAMGSQSRVSIPVPEDAGWLWMMC